MTACCKEQNKTNQNNLMVIFLGKGLGKKEQQKYKA